jgi:DNA polymerase-3 subunit beta
MSIVVGVRELRDALSSCMMATGKDKDGLISNVHAAVSNGSLCLTATDKDVSIRILLNADTSIIGEVMLPVKRLSAILAEATYEKATIVVDEKNITVKTDSGRFRLATEDARDFPSVPRCEFENCLKIPSAVLRKLIHRTAFATDVQSTRYALGGVMFEMGEGNLVCAATDSRRLAVADAAADFFGSEKFRPAVIPMKLLRLVEKLPEGDVEVSIGDNSAFFRCGGVSCSGRLVEGRFPRYRDVIPKTGSLIINVVASKMLSAVRQAMIVTDEESRGVDFTIDDNEMKLASAGAQIGSSEVRLDIETKTNNPKSITVTMDPKYVSDMLKAIPAEEVVSISFIDADTAVVFRNGDNYLYVNMPLSRE